jgi:hypothetical protein
LASPPRPICLASLGDVQDATRTWRIDRIRSAPGKPQRGPLVRAGPPPVAFVEEINYELAGLRAGKTCLRSQRASWPCRKTRTFFEGDHSHHIGFFYYRKRGVLFLFVGFLLQLIADLIG